MFGNKKKTGSRRKWKRYKSRGGAVIRLNLPARFAIGEPKPVDFGPLVDISMGGLAAQYIHTPRRSSECEQLTVAIPGHGVEIPDLPFRTVRDYAIHSLPDEKVIRGRCVEFGRLSHLQNYQLEAFIESYTFAPLVERRYDTDRRRQQDPRFRDPAFRARHERRKGTDRRSPKAA